MIKKLLIANRGEIACRAIKTARKLGIQTISVYSEADRDALHVSLADESYFIGESAPAKSYLNIPKIIEACIKCDADAVYPGYGFLSENEKFVEALDKEGIVFVGPTTHAISVMGDKITSKKMAENAGVNIIPGFIDILQDASHAVALANRIGYPVMLKASKGGGGKGMRIARTDEECREGFERAQSEAIASFGDGTMFVEKFVDQPRHIEIQLIADKHGNCLYLNERECSIQRRHQKVIEEAPSAFIDAETRRAMGEQAVALAHAVNYCSAGTVEFVVDGQRNFYFLEMNTRLQVEHPVTEYITGLDLIELMIKVANDEVLPLSQSDVQCKGWAIESRIYAEDPYRGFVPSIGRLSSFLTPEEGLNVRIDTGVESGSEISMFYDPMIAKLITWDEDRPRAIAQMQNALDNFRVEGVKSNTPFLASLLRHPRFQQARLTTAFIDEEYPSGFAVQIPENADVFVVAVATVHYQHRVRASLISGVLPGHEYTPSSEWVVVGEGLKQNVSVFEENGHYCVNLNDRNYIFESSPVIAHSIIRTKINGESYTFQIDRDGNRYSMYSNGYELCLSVYTRNEARCMELMPAKTVVDMSNFVVSPMPGLLISVSVEEGQLVETGEEIAVIEAMKMENILRAEKDGQVKKVFLQEGATVEPDQIIVEFSTEN